jgi:hypothetical protein
MRILVSASPSPSIVASVQTPRLSPELCEVQALQNADDQTWPDKTYKTKGEDENKALMERKKMDDSMVPEISMVGPESNSIKQSFGLFWVC